MKKFLILEVLLVGLGLSLLLTPFPVSSSPLQSAATPSVRSLSVLPGFSSDPTPTPTPPPFEPFQVRIVYLGLFEEEGVKKALILIGMPSEKRLYLLEEGAFLWQEVRQDGVLFDRFCLHLTPEGEVWCWHDGAWEKLREKEDLRSTA